MTAYTSLVLSGQLAPGQTWSTHCDFQMIGNDQPTQAALTTWLNSVHTALGTMWSATGGISSGMASHTTLAKITAYWKATPASPAAVTAQHVEALVGGQSSQLHPEQVAVVTSLVNGLPGRKNRGRMYWPANAASLATTNGQLTSTQAGFYSSQLATFITACNAATIGSDAVGAAPINAADNDFYTAVRTDSRCDIQRRRADKVSAAFVQSSTIS